MLDLLEKVGTGEKKESVGALMTEKWLFKCTESAWSLRRAYWLILKGAILEVLYSTKLPK
jgi:hypothetical protein